MQLGTVFQIQSHVLLPIQSDHIYVICTQGVWLPTEPAAAIRLCNYARTLVNAQNNTFFKRTCTFDTYIHSTFEVKRLMMSGQA